MWRRDVPERAEPEVTLAELVQSQETVAALPMLLAAF